MLAYGFNHAEAARSFGEAGASRSRLPPCLLGIALGRGPNINMDMSADAEPQAYKLVQRAMALKKRVRKGAGLHSEPCPGAIPATRMLTAAH